MKSPVEYGPEYYGCYYGQQGPSTYSRENPHWLLFFAGVADEIVRRLNVRRVLDIGCAMGFLVECLRDRGLEASHHFGNIMVRSEWTLVENRDGDSVTSSGKRSRILSESES